MVTSTTRRDIFVRYTERFQVSDGTCQQIFAILFIYLYCTRETREILVILEL